MKKHILQKLSLFTAVVMLLSVGAAMSAHAAATAVNLVHDGEFELAIGGSGWRYYDSSSTAENVTISPDEGLGGGSCLKLDGGVKCGAKYSVTIPEEDRGVQRNYIFSVYCKTTKGGVVQFPYIKCIRYDENGTKVGNDVDLVNDNTTVAVSNEWIKITKPLVIQENVTFFELQLRTADTANTTSNDYVLFDKVMIEETLFTNSYGYGFESKTGAAAPSGDTATAVWQSDTDDAGNYAAHGGKVYLKLYNGKGGAAKSFDFSDSAVTNLQNQCFRLSFWLKSSTTDKGTADGVAAFKIFRKTSTGSKAGSTALPSSRINKVGDWYYMTPQKADTWEKFTIYFTFGGDGVAIPMSICVPKDVPGYTSVSVDDIVLTRVPETTMHGFGDLYDNDGAVSFSAGETVSAQTYYVPETAGATATMFTGLYEEKEGAVVLKDVQVKALSDQGLYESAFTVPQTGNYFVKSCIWNIGENTLSAMKDSILITQQAS